MWNRIKRIFALPVFEDEQKTRTAGVQHVILLVMAVGPMLGFLSLDMGGADKSAEPFILIGMPILSASCFGLLVLNADNDGVGIHDA